MDLLHQEIVEQVGSFATVGREVQVTFTLAAAIYRPPAEREDFVQAAAGLAAGWQSQQPVKAIVRGDQIISVGPA